MEKEKEARPHSTSSAPAVESCRDPQAGLSCVLREQMHSDTPQMGPQPAGIDTEQNRSVNRIPCGWTLRLCRWHLARQQQAPARTKRKREEDNLSALLEPPEKRSTVENAALPISHPAPRPSTSAPPMSMDGVLLGVEERTNQDWEQDNIVRAPKEPLENRFRESNIFLPDRHSSPPPQVSLEREGEQEDSLRHQEGEDDVVYVDDVMNLPLWPEPYQTLSDAFMFSIMLFLDYRLNYSPYSREM